MTKPFSMRRHYLYSLRQGTNLPYCDLSPLRLFITRMARNNILEQKGSYGFCLQNVEKCERPEKGCLSTLTYRENWF